MFEFDKTKRDELERWLFFSHIQDALVESFEMNEKKRVLNVSAFHPVFEEVAVLSMTGAKATVLRGKCASISSDRILSITVMNPLRFIYNGNDVEIDTGIPLVFEMESGQIIMVTAVKVFAETRKYGAPISFPMSQKKKTGKK